jgi:hypothetical protein
MAATPTEWTDLATPAGFERCVLGTMREVYGYVGLLVGRDRSAAEQITGDVYRSLFRVTQSGRLDSITLGALRSAARESWLDDNRIAVLAQAAEAGSYERASTLADLSKVERAVMVFCHVNRMPVERAARELGLDENRMRAIESRAITRLRGHDDSSGRWIRAFYGDAVVPGPGLADRIIHRIGASPASVVGSPEDATAPTAIGAVGEAHLDGGAERDDDTAVKVASDSLPIDVDSLRPDPVRMAPRRWPLVLAGLLVAGLLGVLFVVNPLGGDDGQADGDSVPVGSTDALPTTQPVVSTEPPTTPATAPATTIPPVTPHLEPACTSRPATGDVPEIDEQAIDSFGPLGTVPNLAITLPESVTPAGTSSSRAAVARVPGGVLVTVEPNPTDSFHAGIVARVGVDGSVDWVQCFATRVAVSMPRRLLGSDDLPEAVITSFGGDGPTWNELSLADGAVGAALDPALARQIERAWSAPPAAPDGVAHVEYLDEGLAGFDVDGKRVWTDTTAHPPSSEGFVLATTDEGSVVAWCPNPDSDPACDGFELRGYDPATGVGLWRLEGRRQVAVVSGKYALVTEPGDDGDDDWIMITIRDGVAVEGQRWQAADTFAGLCCGEGDFTWVDIAGGGIVVVGKPGSLAVWYPEQAELGAATVAIP